jgi:hypothetical protein
MAVIATPNNTQATSACPQLPDGAFAITPSDANTFAQPVSVYVGGAGAVVVTPANGNADVTITMPAGSMIPFRVVAVKATTTTATLLVGVY